MRENIFSLISDSPVEQKYQNYEFKKKKEFALSHHKFCSFISITKSKRGKYKMSVFIMFSVFPLEANLIINLFKKETRNAAHFNNRGYKNHTYCIRNLK